MFNEIKKEINWNGETLELSTGKIARQADGAVMLKIGNSVVQSTAVSAKEAKEGAGFFPLTVNYQEKAYAAGKIPGGFFKRETGRSEKEILISRLIDRPIRPLFHSGFFNETQILCTVHSFDPQHNTDILALIGASAALAISGVPFLDIIAASRVGMIDGKLILNPSIDEMEESDLDLLIAGTKDSVMMVESEANFLTEAQMLEAVKFGHDGFQPVIKMIEELKKEAGKPAWEVSELFPVELKNEIRDLVKDDVTAAFALKSKQDRYEAIDKISAAMNERFLENDQYTEMQISSALSKVKAEVLRVDTLKKKTRIDGRRPDEVRAIESEVSLFPNVHGSALFTRGETQAIVSSTLGTGQDEQIFDGIEGEYKENFLLNYSFPPYSVGEAYPLRAPSRREIGHGKLAWRALKKSIPSKDVFPYTIRVVSEISESNGSSSMATVCGASMSMMDAGVPLKTPISGIAMGLIKEGDEFMVLSDIIADEDSLGDMDFKVAGSRDGVTALQMDIKVAGITIEIMEKALDQARNGRVHILDKMAMAIESTAKLSSTAPVIISFMVKKDKIREIIGPGGKVIREICDTTGAKIDINDDGKVSVSAVGQDSLDSAVKMVKEIAIDPEIGNVYDGVVVKILDAGAFVNYTGSRDGFVHISEISPERVESVASVLKEGQKVRVKLIGFDRGKAKLTIKNADSEAAPKVAQKKVEQEKVDLQKDNQPSKKKEEVKKEGDNKPNNTKKRKRIESESSSDEDVTERKYFN